MGRNAAVSAFWCREIVADHDSPGFGLRHQNLPHAGSEGCSIHCAPDNPGAKGAEALSLVPHSDLPRKRVMFVLTLVSSMKTTRRGACAMAGNVRRSQ